MAQKLLIMGESGTGKSTSLRNCDPAKTAVVNPVGKALPFKGSGKFTMLNSVTDSRSITKFMKEQAAAGKKLLVVDDFQYILAVPYMNRIKESGWDKYNDFGANYFDIIEVCKEIPEDVVVAYMTHLETLDNGLTTVKLIGKLLREKITIEGLFTVVLRTSVSEGKYYFLTQNSGKDTVKSPLGMFPTYAIDNDLNYVADKIRNYYEVGDFKSDAEMEAEDAAASAAQVEKPAESGRRSRSKKKDTVADVDKGTGAIVGEPAQEKTREQVIADNKAKLDAYTNAQMDAVTEAAGDRESVPFEEAEKAMDSIPAPDLEPVPRRTRRERSVTPEPSGICEVDTYFYIPETDNYVKKHAGDPIPEGGHIITEKEFGEGIKRIAQEGQQKPVESPMNPPEVAPARRTRRVRNI